MKLYAEMSITLQETHKQRLAIFLINKLLLSSSKINSINKINQNTKLRLMKNSSFGLKNYLKDNKYAPQLLSIKLNMIELRANYKGKYSHMKCRRCGKDDETIEHLWSCSEFKKRMPRKKPLQTTKIKDLRKIWSWYCSFIDF